MKKGLLDYITQNHKPIERSVLKVSLKFVSTFLICKALSKLSFDYIPSYISFWLSLFKDQAVSPNKC